MSALIWIIVAALLVGGVSVWLIVRGHRNTRSSRRSSATVVVRGEAETPPEACDEEKIRVLESEIASLQERLQTQSNEMELSRRKEESLRGNLKKERNERESLRKEMESLIAASAAEGGDGAIVEELKKSLDLKTEQLSETQETIEDLEDEISSVKKRLSKTKRDLAEFSDQLGQREQELKSTRKQLEYTELERDEAKSEDMRKKEAIDFVNAILEAENADDRDAEIQNVKVQKVVDIVTDQYVPLLLVNKGNADRVKRVREIVLHWANLQRKSWLKGKKVIAFIGEFSAGKTSIVNRILSQDDPDCPRLPVSSKATTAIATYISYGTTFLSQFTDANGNLKKIDRSVFEKVSKEILSQVNVSSVIRHFVMKYHNENLKGLSILDTPGFSSNDQEDQARTLEVIHEADALFWVMDANAGEINRTSLKIISENANDLPLHVIINKSDTKSAEELDQLEEHIRKTMERAGIQVRSYIRFSQKSDLSELMSVVRSLPDMRSGLDIAEICWEILSAINQRSQEVKMLTRAIHKAETQLEQLDQWFAGLLATQEDACQQIKTIPQLHTRWFHADDYRMDAEDHHQLEGCCDSVLLNCQQLNTLFERRAETQSDYSNKKNQVERLKSQKSELVKIRKYLWQAIQDLDDSLLPQMEEIFRARQQTAARQQVQEEETSGTCIKPGHVAGTNHNSPKVESGKPAASVVKDWITRGKELASRGKKDEAAYWLIRAVRAGSKEALQQCRRYGINYYK